MSNRTPIYIVCSPRAHVGKTFVARLTADFLRLDRKPVNIFDINPHDPVLANFIPRQTQVIDITSIHDQIAMFDRLVRDDEIAKVVDLGSPWFERFFTVAHEINFVREAQRQGVDPVILFPVDPHPGSGPAYLGLQKRFPELTLIPVYNDAVAKGAQNRDQFPGLRDVSVPLHIALLPPVFQQFSENPRYSFADFQESLPIEIPLGLSFELRAWTGRAFREFREMELRLILRKLKASLKDTLGRPEGDEASNDPAPQELRKLG